MSRAATLLSWPFTAAGWPIRCASIAFAASIALAALPAGALPRAPYLDDPLVHPRLELRDPEPPEPRRPAVRTQPFWVAIDVGLLHRSIREPIPFGAPPPFTEPLSLCAMLLVGVPIDRLPPFAPRLPLHSRAIGDHPTAPRDAGGAQPAPRPAAPSLKPPSRAAKLDLPLLTPAKLPAPPAAPAAPASVPQRRIPVAVTPSAARAAVRAALKHARLEDADARVDALAARARVSAALPELRLRVSRTVDEGQSLSPTEYDPTRVTATGGTSLWLEARATWKLDRLVFADEEVALERVRHDRATARAKVVTEVLHQLFAWQRALTIAEDPAASPEEHLAATLKVLEAEADLDLATDGWFSRWREQVQIKVK